MVDMSHFFSSRFEYLQDVESSGMHFKSPVAQGRGVKVGGGGDLRVRIDAACDLGVRIGAGDDLTIASRI